MSSKPGLLQLQIPRLSPGELGDVTSLPLRQRHPRVLRGRSPNSAKINQAKFSTVIAACAPWYPWAASPRAGRSSSTWFSVWGSFGWHGIINYFVKLVLLLWSSPGFLKNALKAFQEHSSPKAKSKPVFPCPAHRPRSGKPGRSCCSPGVTRLLPAALAAWTRLLSCQLQSSSFLAPALSLQIRPADVSSEESHRHRPPRKPLGSNRQPRPGTEIPVCTEPSMHTDISIQNF